MRLPGWIERSMERRHGDTSGPTVLHYRRIYILPTGQGVLFATILLVMWVAAINYSNNMAFMLTFLLAGIFLAMMNHVFRNLVGLAITPLAAEPVFAGEAAAFPLQLTNQGQRERTDIGVGIDAAQGSHDIPPDERRRAVVRVTTRHRGHLRPGRITLDTHYPGGLFRAWSWVRPAVDCLVYPQPERAGPEPPSRGTAGGYQGQRGSGDEDFDGLRRYRHGDPVRRIAWKATSARELQIKEFSGGESEELLLAWQDTADLMSVEQRISRLCHWVLTAEDRGARYALQVPGTDIAAGTGHAHRDACLAVLAELTP